MIEALGYVGITSNKLEDWASFGERWLGMQLVERTRTRLAFRMDDRKQRLVVSSEPEANCGQAFGWEVADAGTLDRLAAHLETHGVVVTRLPGGRADERRVAAVIRFLDPSGNVLEAFHGAEAAAEPFAPGRSISGFRTGPLGLGHIVMQVRDLEPALSFYRDILGFRLSDWILDPFVAYFMHVNPRHHSLALISSQRDAIHHLMVELCSLDDVGQAYDMALEEEGRISTTLGRHTNDLMTSFYATTPSEFLLEYGWGGKTVDLASWEPFEVHHGPSLWGHERQWLPQEGRAKAREFRRKAAEDGQRAPVQVMPGNYELTRGVCPWWDAAKARD